MRTCSIDGCDKIHFGRGFCKKHYNRWWKHGDPSIVKPKPIRKGSEHHSWKGGRSKNTQGYITACCNNDISSKPRMLEHRMLAEKVLGKPLPPKAVVHHHGPKEDQCLVICEDQAYHLFIDRRTRAYHACGNADWLKCWICKQYDDPSNMRFYKKGTTYAEHRECRSNYGRSHSNGPNK